MAEALRTTFGTTRDLERATGFFETADYTLQMTGPSGRLFNFADNGSSLGFEPVLFWFARELRRDDLIRRELINLESLADAIANGTPRSDASRMLPLALLWRDASLASNPVLPPSLMWWSQGGAQPQAVMRSAWNDPRAAFVGIKAGCANDSDAHMDIGSFIFESNGIRWAVDLGRESYPHARANGISNTELFGTTQESKRWTIFRCGPESHNLLRFNDAPQRVDARAEITPIERGYSVDLTPVVRDQVRTAQRNVTLNPDCNLTIRDTWSTSVAASSISWQWLTNAAAVPTEDGFLLNQSGETLRLVARADAKLILDVEDVSAPRNKFDSPNPGLVRLRIRLETRGKETSWIEVTASSK